MAMRPDEIASLVKSAKEYDRKIVVSESGKSVYVDDKKYTDYHYANNNVKK